MRDTVIHRVRFKFLETCLSSVPVVRDRIDFLLAPIVAVLPALMYCSTVNSVAPVLHVLLGRASNFLPLA